MKTPLEIEADTIIEKRIVPFDLSDATKKRAAESRTKHAEANEANGRRIAPDVVSNVETEKPKEATGVQSIGHFSDEFDAGTVAELAKLTLLEYDRRRKNEAERLDVRVEILDRVVKQEREESKISASIFEHVEPWPNWINPSELLNEVSATILRFIVCSDHAADAAALWVAMTWVIDAVHTAPLAIITAPEKRCGKTQLLTIFGSLCYRAISASNITPAAFFRIIDAYAPTLVIDEVDRFLKDKEELIGIINSGNSRDNAFVIRTEGDDHTPKRFSTFGAKALSGIGHLSDTIMDRAVVLELRRKLSHENVDRLRHAEFDLFLTLKQKLARFAVDYIEAVRKSRPTLPEALNDRAMDNWEGLLAIADVAGGDWPSRAREASLIISGEKIQDENLTKGVELLKNIKEFFDEKGITRSSSAELREWLCEDDEKRWSTYNRGKEISPMQIAKILKNYGIKSKDIRTGYRVLKGFEIDQFSDAFHRYLPTENSPEKVATKGSCRATEKNAATPRTASDNDVALSRLERGVPEECEVSEIVTVKI